ncbi:MAG TPA: hypothetical protein PLU52_09070, partial [Opitutaceae bacterium]|nr:hypothetical protein [Opitutaceae bacterium]
MPALLPRGLLLACLLAVTARASSLVSVTTTPLSAADVAALGPGTTAAYDCQGTPVIPGGNLDGAHLPGLDPSLRLATAAVQDGAL